MNDDVIKLREALHAAEPFLFFLLNERTQDYNNTHLEKALSMVRDALDMPPIPSKKPAADPLYDEIELVNFIEHENGMTTATFDIGENASRILIRIGLTQLLRQAAESSEP